MPGIRLPGKIQNTQLDKFYIYIYIYFFFFFSNFCFILLLHLATLARNYAGFWAYTNKSYVNSAFKELTV